MIPDVFHKQANEYLKEGMKEFFVELMLRDMSVEKLELTNIDIQNVKIPGKKMILLIKLNLSLILG